MANTNESALIEGMRALVSSCHSSYAMAL
jgi:hypothetical protein